MGKKIHLYRCTEVWYNMGVEIILYWPPGLYRNLFKAVPVGAGAVFIFEAMIIIAILNVVSLV